MSPRQKEYSTELIIFLKEKNGYASNNELQAKFSWFSENPRDRDVLTENLKADNYIQNFGNSDRNFMLLPKGWDFESWTKEIEQKIIYGKLAKTSVDLNIATVNSFKSQNFLTWAVIIISGLSFIIALIGIFRTEEIRAYIQNDDGFPLKIINSESTTKSKITTNK